MKQGGKVIDNFLDAAGRLTKYPSKHQMKLLALAFLSSKLETNRRYSEKELNQILNNWSTFGDPATLRRELYNNRFIDRKSDGSEYWLEEKQPSIDEL